jgi:FkbM family methyltransferase
MSLEIPVFTHYKNYIKHHSQLGQDIFVLLASGFKKNGYFVDFGATNGVDINNTFLLEKEYDWQGVVCEPSKKTFSELCKNRTCIKENLCVFNKSGSLVDFMDCEAGDLSTIVGYGNDKWSWNRKKHTVYQVETITLDDLLDKHNAPQVIDYLSVDTEGSEFDILSAFSFNRDVNIITVEHNHTENRENIKTLLYNKGFTRLFEQISDFDDWYINNSLIK